MSSGQGVTQVQDGIAFKVNAPIISTGTLPDRGTVFKIDASQAKGGALTTTLPPAASMTGQLLILKRVDSSANILTIKGSGGETLDGASSQNLVPLGTLTIVSDGAAWIIVQQTDAGILPIVTTPNSISIQTSNLTAGTNIVVTGGVGVVVGSSPVTVSISANPIFPSISVSALVPGQVVFPGGGGLLTGSPNLLWDNTLFQLKVGAPSANAATIHWLNNGAKVFEIYRPANTSDLAVDSSSIAQIQRWTNTGNVALFDFFNGESFGGGVGVLNILAAPTPPTSNPTNGAIFWVAPVNFAVLSRNGTGGPVTQLNLFTTPEAYGAKGDGTTDDGVAIQSAINAAAAVPGGVVIFGPKTYAYATGLTLPTQVTLRGAGKYSTILEYGGSGTALQADGTNNSNKVVVEGLTVRVAVNNAVAIDASRFIDSSFLSMRVSWKSGTGQVGILANITNVTWTSFFNVLSDVTFDGLPTGLKLDASVAQRANRWRLLGCTFLSCGTSMLINNVQGIQIVGCYSDQHTVTAINLGASADRVHITDFVDESEQGGAQTFTINASAPRPQLIGFSTYSGTLGVASWNAFGANPTVIADATLGIGGQYANFGNVTSAANQGDVSGGQSTGGSFIFTQATPSWKWTSTNSRFDVYLDTPAGNAPTLNFQSAGSTKFSIYRVAATNDLAFDSNALSQIIYISNAGVTTYKGEVVLIQGSASTPGIGFTSRTNDGFFSVAATQIGVTTGGTENFRFDGINGVFRVPSSSGLSWDSGALGTGIDTNITRDGSGIVAVKNGANAMALRIYGTTAGTKYVSLSHDGTNGILDTASAAGLLSLAPTNATAIQAGKPINLVANAAPSTSGAIWYDSTQTTLSAYEAGIKVFKPGCIFTATANVALNNSNAETSMYGTGVGTQTLPANFLVIGKEIRGKITGFYTTGVAPQNVTIKIKLGTNVIASATFTPLVSITNLGWELEFKITCRTTGGGGTVFGQGRFIFDSTTLTAAQVDFAVATGTVAVDTTATQKVDVTFTCAAADASATYTSTNGNVDIAA